MTTPILAIPALSLRGVASTPRDDAPALDVSFEARRRVITAVLGEPGSGKTATLRAIAGLDLLEGGAVTVEGADVTARAPHLRGLGYVPRGFGLASDLTVGETIRFGLRAARRSSMEREIRLAELVHLLDLADRGDELTGRLAVLERMRLSIARALCAEPVLLLLDDPLAALRGRQRDVGRRTLRAFLERLRISVLLTTTDPDDAAALAESTAVMEAGRVTQTGPTSEVLARPGTVSTAVLAGYDVLLEGRVEAGLVRESHVGAAAVPPRVASGSSVHLLAHPSGLRAVPTGHGLGLGVTGTVLHCRPMGPMWLTEVALGQRATLLARWEWDSEPPAVGDQVELAANTVRIYVEGQLLDDEQAQPPAVEPVERPAVRISNAG
ncbi:MAG: ATP-binding cassette domain-containing protein [Dehalococcoidia bacterium]